MEGKGITPFVTNLDTKMESWRNPTRCNCMQIIIYC